MQNKKMVLFTVIGLIVLFVAGTFMYQANETKKYEELAAQKAKLFQRDYSIVIGNKDAKVQLVEFFDPACETCAQFHPYVKDIMKKNEGNIKLVLRYAPFHKGSDMAVKMLLAANEQGKFMDVLEFMFYTQRYWTQHHEVKPQILWRILPKVKGLDMEKMSKSMNNPEFDKIITQELADAKELGASKTPSYFVNGKPLQTFGLDNLVQLINSEL